jgi:hypothetical protein
MTTAIAIGPMMRNVLERGKDPARSHEGKPYGEDRAEDCADDPAHVLSMRPGIWPGRRLITGVAAQPAPGW